MNTLVALRLWKSVAGCSGGLVVQLSRIGFAILLRKVAINPSRNSSHQLIIDYRIDIF